LACEWAGIETVAFCEREPFCQKVLRKHWPHVPIYDDVCTLTKERLEADGIGTIDIIHGGFPCQPFSIAGEQLGENDDRHLWPEMFRIIAEIRPTWIVGENVAGFIRLALDNTLSDLESIGYTTRTFVLPACAVGADHRRDRTFIVAYASSKRLERVYDAGDRESMQLPPISFPWHNWQATPRILRRNHGIPDALDRVKALGNAVVPQQIYPILAAIKQIDNMLKEMSA
jgi:DNA (cytosine-5)-methyltransferase 1